MHGYGTIVIDGTTHLAHRLAYRLSGKHIPHGMVVMHSCDNRKCINIDHLMLGTYADNTMDMLLKNRQASKLTVDDVIVIRQRCANGELQRIVAEDFGITQCGVSAVVLRKIWKHVD